MLVFHKTAVVKEMDPNRKQTNLTVNTVIKYVLRWGSKF